MRGFRNPQAVLDWDTEASCGYRSSHVDFLFLCPKSRENNGKATSLVSSKAARWRRKMPLPLGTLMSMQVNTLRLTNQIGALYFNVRGGVYPHFDTKYGQVSRLRYLPFRRGVWEMVEAQRQPRGRNGLRTSHMWWLCVTKCRRQHFSPFPRFCSLSRSPFCFISFQFTFSSVHYVGATFQGSQQDLLASFGSTTHAL